MDQIVAMVAERAGISTEQAQKAVDTVLSYLNEHPDQLQGLVGAGGAGGMVGKIGKLFGR